MLYHRRPIFLLPVPVRPDGPQLLLAVPQLLQEPAGFPAGHGQIAAVAQRLMEQKLPHSTVRIAFTPDEEIGSGMEDFDVDAFGAKYA